MPNIIHNKPWNPFSALSQPFLTLNGRSDYLVSPESDSLGDAGGNSTPAIIFPFQASDRPVSKGKLYFILANSVILSEAIMTDAVSM